jgi:cytochrome c556
MKSKCVLAAVVLCVSCAVLFAEKQPEKRPTKVESDVLPNAYRLSDNVISGGHPAGEPAFKQLKELGVKTVISVDGATPNVKAAKKYGLRYVHLPHGYDGIPDKRLVELTKGVRDLPGPIYIHCHHGKHRSPAAAAAVCIAAGILTNAEGLAFLDTAGTSKNYRGLYQTVREAKPIDAETLANTKVEFREVAEIPPLADAMIAIEHTHDHLKAVAAAGWKPTEKHADIDPAHEALLLQEHYTELLRTNEVKKQPAEFRQLLEQGEAEAKQLGELLRARQPDHKKIDALFGQITAGCASCHQKFRDVPLKEKAAAK